MTTLLDELSERFRVLWMAAKAEAHEELTLQAPQPGAGGGAQTARRNPVEDVQGTLSSIGRLIGGLGLGKDQGGGGPSGGAGGTGSRRGFGAGAGLVRAAQREVRLGLMQGEFGLVEAETPRGLADRAGFEFDQRHVKGGSRLPVAALLGEGGQQRPGVELGRTRPPVPRLRRARRT